MCGLQSQTSLGLNLWLHVFLCNLDGVVNPCGVVNPLNCLICETGMGGRSGQDKNGCVMHLAQLLIHGQHEQSLAMIIVILL